MRTPMLQPAIPWQGYAHLRFTLRNLINPGLGEVVTQHERVS